MSKILLLGKNGQVGWELQHALEPLGNVIALDRSQLDLTQPDAIRQTMRELAPDIVVNAAGYTSVDKAETEAALAMQVNGVAPGIIAVEAAKLDALLIHYSTDYVFDGTKSTPYTEEDAPNPVNAYGRSKLAGEHAIAAAGGKHLILRTSWIYSARGTNFVLTMLCLAKENKVLAVVDDQIGSPTSAAELAKTTVDVMAKFDKGGSQSGIYHLSATGYTSRLEFAHEIVEMAKQICGLRSPWAALTKTTSTNYPLPAIRPLNASTSKAKIMRIFGVEMPAWRHQLLTELNRILASSAHNTMIQ